MLNFTRQERVVVYFLIITLGIGAVLKLVRNKYSVDEIRPTRFYREESEFKSIAEQINSDSLISKDSSQSDMGVNTSRVDTALTNTGLVNINTATVSELVQLPGIGPAIAKRIKTYTDLNGPFKHKTDIVLVKGIGEKLYSRIEGLVTTE